MNKTYFSIGIDNNIREIYSKPRKRKFMNISAPSINFIFQSDLFFFKNKVILTVIDIYSRKAYAVLIANKKPNSVLKGFKIVVKKMGKPKVLMIDGGKEFMGDFDKYLKDNNIEKRISEGNSLEIKQIKTKQGIIERYNRTILGLLRTYLAVEDKINFGQKDLDILNEDYNNHKHSSLGYSPNEIVAGMIPKKKRNMRIDFNIGDSVRILLQRQLIEKNSKTKRFYSKEVYYIVDIDNNRYRLSDGEWYKYTRLKMSKSMPTVWIGDKKKRFVPKEVLRRSKRLAKQQPLRQSQRLKNK